MAQQTINLGTVANDGTGDTLRVGGDKINDNFTELYAGLTGLLDFKGSTDCSANPNYPAASKGDYYLVSVAGKIGGASGIVVSVGDSYFATADNAGGTQASVGTSWTVVEGNLGFAPVNKAGDTMTGDLIVPAEAYDATAWNGSNEVPTKNDVRDKIEDILDGVTFTGDIVVPDEAYDATAWNGSLEVPTKNAVRDKIESLGGGSFTAASTTEVLTGTDSAKGATPDSLAALWEQGADVASAGTTSLGEGGYFNITGTTTITDIDFATDKAGRKAYVKFAGVLTLTHNASTMILPTGASITTAAGDTACFISEGSDVVRCVAYQRASGAALSGGSSGGWTVLLSAYDFAGGAASTKEVDVTGYKEIEVIGHGLVHAASVQRGVQVSVDGGSTWFTTLGDYQDVAAAGSVADNYMFYGHSTATASARHSTIHIMNNDAIIPVVGNCVTRQAQQVFKGSATAINRVRLVGLASNVVNAGNFTAGTLTVRART